MNRDYYYTRFRWPGTCHLGLPTATLTQPAHSPSSASASPDLIGLGSLLGHASTIAVRSGDIIVDMTDSTMVEIVSMMWSGNPSKWRLTCDYERVLGG